LFVLSLDGLLFYAGPKKKSIRKQGLRIWNYPGHEAAGQKGWVDATLRKGEISLKYIPVFLYSSNVRALLGGVFGEPLFSDTFLLP